MIYLNYCFNKKENIKNLCNIKYITNILYNNNN